MPQNIEIALATANRLKIEVDRNKQVPIERGIEKRLGVRWIDIQRAVMILKSDGYRVWVVKERGTVRKVVAARDTRRTEISRYAVPIDCS